MTILSLFHRLLAIKIIGGRASRQRARSIKQSGGWKPELRHKQPYGSKWTPEGEASAQKLWLVQKVTDEGPLKRSSHRSVHYDSSTSRGAVITIEEALEERSVGRADGVAVSFVKRIHTILQMKQDSTAALNIWRQAKDCRSHL